MDKASYRESAWLTETQPDEQGQLSLHHLVDPVIESMPFLNRYGTEIKTSLHRAILKGGKPARQLADLLHGTWLGHPLHPVMTDVTIGAWVFGAVFDVLYLLTFKRRHRDSADLLTTIGTISAFPTAIAGMTDYSTIKKDAVAYGALHGILNSAGLMLYVLSVRARNSGHHGRGIRLSLMAMVLLLFSAWIGGEMTYRKRVGVNHAPTPDAPYTWTPILRADDLFEGQSRRASAGGYPVLLYRYQSEIYAIGAVCAHAGGPLEKGTFDGACVQCPWHDSVYDLRSGHVVHGPSTYNQPRYEVRIHNEQIEVKLPANAESGGSS